MNNAKSIYNVCCIFYNTQSSCHVCQKLKQAIVWNITTKIIDITHSSITSLNTETTILQSICFHIHIIRISHQCLSKINSGVYEKQRSRQYTHFLENSHYRIFSWQHHFLRRRRTKQQPEQLQRAVCLSETVTDLNITYVSINIRQRLFTLSAKAIDSICTVKIARIFCSL